MRRMLGLAVTVLCCTCSPQTKPVPDPASTSSICIEYFGEQASPLFPVVIGNSKTAAEIGRNETINDTRLLSGEVFVVDSTVMTKLIPEVEAISTHGIDMKKPYVVFHIVVLKDGHRQTKILDGDQTFGLLDRFRKICGQTSLFDHLGYVQRVIRLYEEKSLAM